LFSIFKTPPGLIGSYKSGVTYSNMEQQELQWRAYGLTPLLKMIEEELNDKLFVLSDIAHFVKFNVKALMLTDHNAQANWFKTMFSIGVYSIDEIRDLLDMNPLEEDGDDHYIPVNNLMPVDKVDDYLNNQEEAQPGDVQTDLQTGEKEGAEPEGQKETKKIRKYSIDDLLKRKSITINVNGHAVEE